MPSRRCARAAVPRSTSRSSPITEPSSVSTSGTGSRWKIASAWAASSEAAISQLDERRGDAELAAEAIEISDHVAVQRNSVATSLPLGFVLHEAGVVHPLVPGRGRRLAQGSQVLVHRRLELRDRTDGVDAQRREEVPHLAAEALPHRDASAAQDAAQNVDDDAQPITLVAPLL